MNLKRFLQGALVGGLCLFLLLGLKSGQMAVTAEQTDEIQCQQWCDQWPSGWCQGNGFRCTCTGGSVHQDSDPWCDNSSTEWHCTGEHQRQSWGCCNGSQDDGSGCSTPNVTPGPSGNIWCEAGCGTITIHNDYSVEKQVTISGDWCNRNWQDKGRADCQQNSGYCGSVSPNGQVSSSASVAASGTKSVNIGHCPNCGPWQLDLNISWDGGSATCSQMGCNWEDSLCQSVTPTPTLKPTPTTTPRPTPTATITPTPEVCRITRVSASDQEYFDRIVINWTAENCAEAEFYFISGGGTNDSYGRMACSQSLTDQPLGCGQTFNYCVACKKEDLVYNQKCDIGSTKPCHPTPTQPTSTLTPTATPPPTVTPTVTSTPTPTNSPTPTPTPTSPVDTCFDECSSDSQCESGLRCLERDDVRRCLNIDCESENDCTCNKSCWDVCGHSSECSSGQECRQIGDTKRCDCTGPTLTLTPTVPQVLGAQAPAVLPAAGFSLSTLAIVGGLGIALRILLLLL